MNKKILFLFLFIALAFVLEVKAAGFTTSSSGYVNNGVDQANYIINTENNLILDISLPDPATDTVLAGSGVPTAGSTIITTNPWSGAAVPVFFYDNGNNTWASANDGIFTDDDSSGTYTVGDTQLAGTGTPVIGSAIITTNPWSTVFFYDNSNNVWASGSDGIFYDIDGSGYYNGDKISSVYISNSAPDSPAGDSEVSSIKIWQESDGASGFQSSSDTSIGSKTSSPFWGQTITCSSAVVYTASSKDRLYITINVSGGAINKRAVKAAISVNGLSFVSSSDGPTDTAIVNSNSQTILTQASIDQIRPTSSINDPSMTTVILPGQTYTITGVCADTGGSNVQKTEISFDNGIAWFETTPLIAQNNGFTWKYIWSNIPAGTYTLKTRASDWIGNVEIPTTGLNITVAVIQQETSTSTATSTVQNSTSSSQNSASETLKAKIIELQLKLIELLKQLIELLKARI